MIIRKIARLIVFLAIIPMLSGCWLLAAAGVGAAGGYIAKDKGYLLQSPVTQEVGGKKTSE